MASVWNRAVREAGCALSFYQLSGPGWSWLFPFSLPFANLTAICHSQLHSFGVISPSRCFLPPITLLVCFWLMTDVMLEMKKKCQATRRRDTSRDLSSFSTSSGKYLLYFLLRWAWIKLSLFMSEFSGTWGFWFLFLVLVVYKYLCCLYSAHTWCWSCCRTRVALIAAFPRLRDF